MGGLGVSIDGISSWNGKSSFSDQMEEKRENEGINETRNDGKRKIDNRLNKFEFFISTVNFG
jgi:hypothetical protein